MAVRSCTVSPSSMPLISPRAPLFSGLRSGGPVRSFSGAVLSLAQTAGTSCCLHRQDGSAPHSLLSISSSFRLPSIPLLYGSRLPPDDVSLPFHISYHTLQLFTLRSLVRFLVHGCLLYRTTPRGQEWGLLSLSTLFPVLSYVVCTQ